jgi:ABC-type proline/glycine betaine transport system permease subunit
MGLGSRVAVSPLLQQVLRPYIIASQAMPKLALAPVFAIWFGFGTLPKALLAALMAFFPLIENTLTGLSNVDAEAVELFRMLGASRWHAFLKLRLPKIRNAATVHADTQQHGLGWFNLELLEKVEHTFRDLGLTKQPLDVRQLFTNALVQAL